MADPRPEDAMRRIAALVVLTALLEPCQPGFALEQDWQFRGTATVSACAGGRCGTHGERFEGRLILDVDEPLCRAGSRRQPMPCGTYRVVRGGPGCLPGALTPDEVGIVVGHSRNRAWTLEPTNLDEIVAALRECAPGGSLAVLGYRHTLQKRATRRLRVTGSARLRLRLTLRGRVLDVRSRATYRVRETQ